MLERLSTVDFKSRGKKSGVLGQPEDHTRVFLLSMLGCSGKRRLAEIAIGRLGFVGPLIAASLVLGWSTLANITLAATVNITVENNLVGQTMEYIGATESAAFYVDDLKDLGINAYRLWTKMAELEWWDDDDALDGLWDDSEYGTPTIADIKADQPNGFSNTIPWADWWDVRFQEVQAWRYGTQTRQGIISALADNQIVPIVVLRTYDDQGAPEMRPWAAWAPRPPVNQDFRTEWWEHAFAIAYWLNCRNSHNVTHFEVLNEPDFNGQGWSEFGGTEADYVQLVQDAYDAVRFANDIVGIDTCIHAPVVANYGSAYLSDSLDNADSSIQIVDYHTYADDPTTSIASVKSTIGDHNPDGETEPIWVSEWGALWSSYDTLDRALLTAEQLMTFAEDGVEGITIFNMYDWSAAVGQDFGLIDLQDDGMGGVNRIRTETYYALRLMIRALKEAKNRMAFNSNGLEPSGRAMVTQDDDGLYIIVKNANGSVTVDISGVPGYGGVATIYEYSAANRDAIVATSALTDGQFTFDAPASGLILAQVPAVAQTNPPITDAEPEWIFDAHSSGCFIAVATFRSPPC
jgi:hypothetical protein